MKKKRERNKIIQVKNGFLEFDPDAYLSGVDEFLKVYEDECTKLARESERKNWAPVNCEESQKRLWSLLISCLVGERVKRFSEKALSHHLTILMSFWKS